MRRLRSLSSKPRAAVKATRKVRPPSMVQAGTSMEARWEAGAGANALRGATLVLPVVSVGNVGQLAADLLINTLRLPRAARLQDDALLQAVGGQPYAHVEGLATAMELYQQEQGAAASPGVAVVQQRAPAAPGTQAAFAERLAAFVKQCGVQEVLVLGTIEAMVRRDEQLAGPQLRCWAPGSDGDGGAEASDGASAALLERCHGTAGVPLLEDSFWQDRPLEARSLQPWPLLRALAAAGVPVAALLCFSSEGDNAADATILARAAAKVAGLVPSSGESGGGPAVQWVPPPAWQHVFGRSSAVY